MGEYSDYETKPTKANASAFITRTLEENWSAVQQSDGYMKYIATRPRAERLGDHGLFGDEDGVRWYQAAAAYSDFHARLAQMIAMGLTPDDTLCVWLWGRLPVACACPYVREVTAVDIDAAALAALRAQAAVHNAPPIRIIQAAFPDLPPDSLWDAVVCCFLAA